MGEAIKKDLETHTIAGVAGADARIAAQTNVQKHMELTSVTSLESRDDSIRVATSMGAHAVLRYQAKMDGANVHLRVAIYLVQDGKAVMLEKTVPPTELREAMAKMIKELMPPQGGGAGVGAGGAPESQPAEEDGKPKTSMIIWDAGVHSAGGLVSHFQLGGSVPIGGGANDEFIETGLRVGLHIGWQFQLGQMHGLTPEIALVYSEWGFKAGTYVNTQYGPVEIEGDVSMLNLLGGARYSLFIGAIEAFVAAHVGLGYVSEVMKAVQDPTVKNDEDQTGFALNAEIGGHFMFMKYVGGGLVFDFGKGFIDKMESAREYDAFGFSIALSVKGKLPL